MGGSCGFHPERINATSALLESNSSRVLQDQLFGRACKGKAYEKYMAGRSNEERKFMSMQVDAAEQLIKAKQGETTEDELPDIVTRLANEVAELEEEATLSVERHQRHNIKSNISQGSLLEWRGPDARWSPSWGTLWTILGVAIVVSLLMALAFIPFFFLPR